jgi:hypothetical protein
MRVFLKLVDDDANKSFVKHPLGVWNRPQVCAPFFDFSDLLMHICLRYYTLFMTFLETAKNFDLQKLFIREELNDMLLFENGIFDISCSMIVETPAYFPREFLDGQADISSGR